MSIKQKLKQYKKDGLLISQKHPTLPLEIWNYSQKVQYEGIWDDITISHRATVRHTNGDLVAKSFDKFFNFEEQKHEPTNSFTVYDKLDGSLGLLFYYQNDWVFSSRGSFTSEQAIRGRKMLKDELLTKLDKSNTYVFEIIYPENRIVVDYGLSEELVLIGVFKKDAEQSIEEYGHLFKLPKIFKYKDYSSISSKDEDNKEGYIVKFSNGQRIKIKFPNYLEKHRFLSNCSPKTILERCFLNNESLENVLNDCPDEYFEKIKDWYEKILTSYNEKKSEINSIWLKYKETFDNSTRKEFALAIKNEQYKSFLFKIADKKDIHNYICKEIEKSLPTLNFIFNNE